MINLKSHLNSKKSFLFYLEERTSYNIACFE
jgi:hypothetical protein